MNRGEIEQRVIRYVHRDDLEAADFDFAFAVTARELGQQLRGSVNYATRAVTLTGGAADLGADVREVAVVAVPYSGGYFPLAALSEERLARLSSAQGAPSFYALSGQWLHVAPKADLAAQVSLWFEPTILSDAADSNNVSELYPELYVYRVAQEVAIITQDFELAQAYGQKFQERVQDINWQAKMQSSGNSPGMVIR